MVGAAYAGSNGAVKVSALWLVASYGVVTVGEVMPFSNGIICGIQAFTTEDYSVNDGRILPG